MLYFLSALDLFRRLNFLHMLDCSYCGKIYFLKTDKILPVEIWQKTKCLLILVPRQSHSVVLYLFQDTSSLHKPTYVCLQQMPVLYLVCDGNEVTGPWMCLF